MLYPVELRVRFHSDKLSISHNREHPIEPWIRLASQFYFCDHGCVAVVRSHYLPREPKNSQALRLVALMSKSSTRRFARYRTELPLIVKVLGQDGYLRVHGRCFEIAESGLGAVVTSEFRPGEMVSLEFSFPDVPELQVLRAVVRHRMGFLHGFEFVGLLSEQRERIQQYCQTLAPA